MPDTRPRIALTIGDPAGIGPEIAAKALLDREALEELIPVVVGDGDVLRRIAADAGLGLAIRPIEDPAEATGEPGTVDLLEAGAFEGALTYGKVDPACGRAAVRYIETACELARDGAVDGIVTGPINKEAIRAAGSTFPGHTEMLADLLGVAEHDVFTMFVVEELRIFLLTRHHPLRDAIDRIDEDLVYRGTLRVQALMRQLGYDEPRLALAALNPHAGENGLLGKEEGEILTPALERARADGVQVAGPVPADSAFWQGRQGTHDAVISLYHDQGHIAAKTVSFFGTVSCTLGLPVIRTAAEHGTAFDIAGQGIADPGGQLACMRVAAELAPRILGVRS